MLICKDFNLGVRYSKSKKGVLPAHGRVTGRLTYLKQCLAYKALKRAPYSDSRGASLDKAPAKKSRSFWVDCEASSWASRKARKRGKV
jgi:hypothetical protein